MSEVRTVAVQLKAPDGNQPGQVTSGHYVIEDDTLIMTYPDGKPVDEYLFRMKVPAGVDTDAIARTLTPNVRSMLVGSAPRGFDGPLF